MSEDHIRHIEHTRVDMKNKSWCGQHLQQFDFHFLDIDHAAYNGATGGRLVACKRCTSEIIKAITEGQS